MFLFSPKCMEVFRSNPETCETANQDDRFDILHFRVPLTPLKKNFPQDGNRNQLGLPILLFAPAENCKTVILKKARIC